MGLQSDMAEYPYLRLFLTTNTLTYSATNPSTSPFEALALSHVQNPKTVAPERKSI